MNTIKRILKPVVLLLIDIYYKIREIIIHSWWRIRKLFLLNFYKYRTRIFRHKNRLYYNLCKKLGIQKNISLHHSYKHQTLTSFRDFCNNGTPPKWPIEIFLELSNICDLRCAMCPTFSELNPDQKSNIIYRERGLMPVDFYASSMHDLLSHALVVHAFGYGEPTLHPDFKKHIETLSNYEVLIDFFTHGMHLTPDLCDFLVRKRVYLVTISISGNNQADYESIYQGGNYQQVLEGIKNLSDAKKRANSAHPNISLNTIGFEHHINTLPEFVETAASLGVNNIQIKPLQRYNSISELHNFGALFGQQTLDAINAALKIAEKFEISISCQEFLDSLDSTASDNEANSYKPDIHTLQQRAKSKQRDATHHSKPDTRSTPGGYINTATTMCMEPFTTLYVDYKGNHYPCCFKNNASQALGNINNSSHPWQQADFAEFRSAALAQQYRADICTTCINNKAYPKNHGVTERVAQYSRWFKHNFGKPFHSDIQRMSRNLPDNQAINEIWGNK